MESITTGTGEPLSLPADLRDWVEPAKLAGWVREEVVALDWETHFLQIGVQPPEYRPKVILAVVAYACLTQVFGSDDVIDACHEDPIFVSLSEGKVPFRDELEHFRRANRLMLERVLYGVFSRAVREKLHLGGNPLTDVLENYLRCKAVERVDITRHVDTWDE
jgi:hypothetical protein